MHSKRGWELHVGSPLVIQIKGGKQKIISYSSFSATCNQTSYFPVMRRYKELKQIKLLLFYMSNMGLAVSIEMGIFDKEI